MGLLDPKISTSEKFTDHYEEGERFYLEGIRVVKANTADYGEGEMVLMKVRGHENELGIWGAYLLAQAKAASLSDFPNWYVITRKVVDGFSKRPVKALGPSEAPGQEYDAATFDTMGDAAADDPMT